MAKMNVTYYDLDGAEMCVTVNADDEAAALGCTLDMFGETIQAGSPFSVWREATPRKKAAGARVSGAGAPRVLGKPAPTGENIYDEEEDDEVSPDEDVSRILERDVLPLPEDVVSNKSIKALYADLQASLGVGMEKQ